MLGTSCFAISAATYDQLRAKYKHDLYVSQIGVLNEEEYSEFLEPHLQEAERSLKVAEYCRAHADSELIREYFACLLRFNFACFKKHIATTDVYKKKIKKAHKLLLDVMKRMKAEWNLDDLDPIDDCNKLTQIIERANEIFYKNLGVKHKTLCFFAKVGSIFS